MTETRRTALKMLGAVSATCAFPFAGDELYAQHVHVAQMPPAAAGPYVPAFLTADEFEAVARLAELIIPTTGTPGAVGAGVPAYIDLVLRGNVEHQALARRGLARLERDARAAGAASFAALDEAAAVALIQPASDAVDREDAAARQARFRADASGRLVYHVPVTDRDVARGDARRARVSTQGTSLDDQALPAHFFRPIKNLTADGYYTSRIGLLAELGYVGNGAMLAFPGCVPEA